jgi:hypothetical protein
MRSFPKAAELGYFPDGTPRIEHHTVVPIGHQPELCAFFQALVWNWWPSERVVPKPYGVPHRGFYWRICVYG